jgi:hypothetical protein
MDDDPRPEVNHYRTPAPREPMGVRGGAAAALAIVCALASLPCLSMGILGIIGQLLYGHRVDTVETVVQATIVVAIGAILLWAAYRFGRSALR